MALTAAQVTQVFEIFGIPQNGAGDVAIQASSPDGPLCETYDFSALATKLSARLTALSSEQVARVVTLLTRWDAVSSSSPLRIARSGGGSGTIADHPGERAAIRFALSNLVGFAAAPGGFAAEAARAICAIGVTR